MADGFVQSIEAFSQTQTPTPPDAFQRSVLDAPLEIELRMARDREAMRREAKYPVREWTVLTPEQLEATRAQLGSARVIVKSKAALADRRALTPEELRIARAQLPPLRPAAPSTSDEQSRDARAAQYG